jgi:DNA-binding IclR family transcriptional regulator
MTMSLDFRKQRVLSVLSENLKQPQPEVVDSVRIAEALQMGLAETRQIVKILSEAGAVESDLDGEHSLITREGLLWLQERSA